MKKGDIVFFHPLLVHGSGENKTQGYRKVKYFFNYSLCAVISHHPNANMKMQKEKFKNLQPNKSWVMQQKNSPISQTMPQSGE